MKRTFQPKKRQRTREHGFLSRMKTKNGRKVIAARRSKGRAKLAVRFEVDRRPLVLPSLVKRAAAAGGLFLLHGEVSAACHPVWRRFRALSTHCPQHRFCPRLSPG